MTPQRTPRTEADARDAGFTLLEVIIAASLLLVATIPIYRFLDSSVKNVTTVQGLIQEQASARTALAGIENDLRNAFTGSTALPRVASISSTGMTFYTPDRNTPVGLQKVSYRLSSGSFQKWVQQSSNTVANGASYTWSFPATTAPLPYQTLVRGVTNSTVFEYFDKNNAVLNPAVAGNAALVRVVRVTLDVRDPAAKTTQPVATYQVTIQLRGEG